MATLNFTNYADYVYQPNYYGANTYNLLKGEDQFEGGYSNYRAIVYGGDGGDIIYGGSANDTLHGGTGWDTMAGGYGTDTIYGEAGNDYIAVSDDAYYDVAYGGTGNDHIAAAGDKVVAGDGNDKVDVTTFDNDHADVTLGLGKDTLILNIHQHEYDGWGNNRVDVKDFKAEDSLRIDTAHNDSEWLDKGQVLDRLDVNNDGWLGAKDVEAQDYDGITVHVGQNSLELDIFDTSVVFAGMIKASFDFLA